MRNGFIFLSLLLLAGCATHTDDPNASSELLPDPTYSKWLDIRGLGRPDDDGGVKGVFRTAEKVGTPAWTIAQWASKLSLADPAITQQTQLDKSRFQIANRSKRVVVDCRRGEIDLGLFASACYDHPRQKNEAWPHLLVQTALTDTRYPSRTCHVADIKRLEVAMSCRLDSFVDRHPDADPKLHAAQFQLFLYVQNLQQGDDGFGDMLWFGVPIFDNRYPVKEESYQRDGGKADASGKFIYSLPGKACIAEGQGFVKNGCLLAGKDARWVDIHVDVAPWIAYAYKLARKNGYLATTDFQDLYVSGLNFGWEMPGTYDSVMQVRGFSLTATPTSAQPASLEARAARPLTALPNR